MCLQKRILIAVRFQARKGRRSSKTPSGGERAPRRGVQELWSGFFTSKHGPQQVSCWFTWRWRVWSWMRNCNASFQDPNFAHICIQLYSLANLFMWVLFNLISFRLFYNYIQCTGSRSYNFYNERWYRDVFIAWCGLDLTRQCTWANWNF